ncbi:uncharacterized protein O3C94_008577 [Discoglossus pictus]
MAALGDTNAQDIENLVQALGERITNEDLKELAEHDTEESQDTSDSDTEPQKPGVVWRPEADLWFPNSQQISTNHLTKPSMMKDDKMSERILNHILEILSLLTVKISQHLTNSLTMVEMKQDKKMTERILSHTLEIMSLMSEEEYTIVKNNSPHIQHLTGECDTDGHKETLGTSSHRSSGHVRSSVVSKFDQATEPDVRSHQQVKEEEIPVNIIEGEK